MEGTAAEGEDTLSGSEFPLGALEAAAGRGTAGTLYAQVRRTRAAAEYAAARRETVTVPVPAAVPAQPPWGRRGWTGSSSGTPGGTTGDSRFIRRDQA